MIDAACDLGEYMKFVAPQHSRTKVDWAGDVLICDDPNLAVVTLDEAFGVIDNWRSSHSWPLQCIRVTLNNRAKKASKKSLVAQRLKRLESIEAKLRRFGKPRADGKPSKMKLSQMQDIGGCRAVVPSPWHLARLVKVYDRDFVEAHKRPRPDRSLCYEKYDYIKKPKADGYRGVHFVYKYQSGRAAHAPHQNLRIEVQLRTGLQHAWATAVETAGIFTKQALKSNVGSENWLRFFALMGSAIAMRERRPLVPGLPTDRKALLGELKELAMILDVRNILTGYRFAVERLTGPKRYKQRLFLLVLDPDEHRLATYPYNDDQLKEATDRYMEVEKVNRDTRKQAVLVRVSSFDDLRAAYPNFYGDTDVFLAALDEAIGPEPKPAAPPLPAAPVTGPGASAPSPSASPPSSSAL
jgi:hypothetical protein